MKVLLESQIKAIREILIERIIQGTDLDLYFLIRDLRIDYGDEILNKKLGEDQLYSLQERYDRICDRILGALRRILMELGIDEKEFFNEVEEMVNNENWYLRKLSYKKSLNSGESDIANKIKQLKELLDQGILNEEEFNNKKKELLNRM